MKKSFSLIEFIIIIIVVGILYSTVKFTLSNTSLIQASNKLIAHINYTRHLAIKDNKMQYYPISSDNTDIEKSKYWFKQWWQLRIGQNSNGDYFYEIFSDSPDYNKVGGPVAEYAIDPYNKLYMDGNGYNKELNLTYYNIKKILYNGNDVINTTHSIRFVFDNYGNCYTSEGDLSYNPYDNEKKPLLKTAKITLCQDENCDKNVTICLSPKIANTYICN